MAVLDSTQRGQLEKAVIKARRLSVKGAYSALKAFAVDNHEPYAHMSAEEREVRNNLRNKARLLGDKTTTDGGHSIDKLAYELAYEYWHQMLFAKFLEANNLLIHPVHQIAVALEECEELGQEEGFDNKWEAAASYASKMLPAIFRQDDPLMQLTYATEDRLALEQLIENIAEDVFQADDSLGWVYQYWQTEEKERINAEGNPIDGDSISAVTQLFTEPYMVHFLIDNTLGAWWTARNPGVTSPYEFKYLRTLDDGMPAAGSFDGWPETLAEITMLDPCMGSGHFVVDVFMAMATLRMRDEGLTKAEACDAVITDNIHGLELDARCTQIAAFNLALTAWKFCGEYRILPEMNLACCGIAPKGKKEDWVNLANSQQDAEKRTRLKGGLARMYDLFQQAPELGSLIDPTTIEKDVFTSDFEELQPFLEAALNTESGEKANERAVIATGVARAGSLLAKKYIWQITNVPYLGRGRQSQNLMEFCDKNRYLGTNDLATVFIERILRILDQNGVISVVSPQNWLYQKTYGDCRKFLLEESKLNLIAILGAGAFSSISGEVVKATLSIITQDNIGNHDMFETAFIDVSNKKKYSKKDSQILIEKILHVQQRAQIQNDNHRIMKERGSSQLPLSTYSVALHGQAVGDNNSFNRFFWEVPSLGDDWEYYQNAPEESLLCSGRDSIVFWEGSAGRMHDLSESVKHLNHKAQQWRSGKPNWGKLGVCLNLVGKIKGSVYNGHIYSTACCVIVPHKEDHIGPILSFLFSGEFEKEVRKLDLGLAVAVKTMTAVPFDLKRWTAIYEDSKLQNYKLSESNDPTQWVFHSNPLHTESPLQVIISKFLGYEWPAENDEEMELSDEAKKNIKAIKALELPFDEDGIVCIPSVNGEASASDRVRENIMTIWGENYNGSTLSNLIEQEGSNKRDIESYLRDDFFPHHCKLFKNRPFILHIWDGRKDGFAALVNYHKLDKATFEKLIFTYLGDWINQCDLKMQNNVSGADGLLKAAKILKEKLELILKGEPPFDLFIRWKSLEEQPIGWEPDINDGVRMNVYPFIKAGVLRKKFNVKWGKDRGKNPSGSDWGPERWNRYEDLDDEWKLKDEHKNIIPSLNNEVKSKAKKENE